jgi:hypothetical protein
MNKLEELAKFQAAIKAKKKLTLKDENVQKWIILLKESSSIIAEEKLRVALYEESSIQILLTGYEEQKLLKDEKSTIENKLDELNGLYEIAHGPALSKYLSQLAFLAKNPKAAENRTMQKCLEYKAQGLSLQTGKDFKKFINDEWIRLNKKLEYLVKKIESIDYIKIPLGEAEKASYVKEIEEIKKNICVLEEKEKKQIISLSQSQFFKRMDKLCGDATTTQWVLLCFVSSMLALYFNYKEYLGDNTYTNVRNAAGLISQLSMVFSMYRTFQILSNPVENDELLAVAPVSGKGSRA